MKLKIMGKHQSLPQKKKNQKAFVHVVVGLKILRFPYPFIYTSISEIPISEYTQGLRKECFLSGAFQ